LSLWSGSSLPIIMSTGPKKSGEWRRSCAAGAESVLTTEKDVVNLCDEWEGLFAPVRVYWLRIEMEVDGGEEFAGDCSGGNGSKGVG
jgi:hypothetical protein